MRKALLIELNQQVFLSWAHLAMASKVYAGSLNG